MWKWIQSLFKPLDAEQYYGRHPLAKTTPDELLAGYIIDSFSRNSAENFDDWQIASKDTYNYSAWMKIHSKKFDNWAISVNRAFYNKKLKITMLYNRIDDKRRTNFYINDVPISDKEGNYIINCHTKVKEKVDDLRKAAAEAKKVMEENESRWNLVEDILGLERNGLGALVPKQKV